MAEMENMAEVEGAEQEPSILMFDSMTTYQEAIQKLREVGASKRSYDRVRQEYHQYMQQYPIPSFAVDLCVQSFTLAAAEHLAKKTKPDLALKACRLAYCAMLPKLVNRESIRDFIACVVNGMAMDMITGPEGTRLLYGAQVAHAALPPTRRWRKPAKTQSESAPKCTQTAPKQPSNFAQPDPDQPLTH